jgi:hypothetical protein
MFEPVHTMTDYYDGPRRGIADYRGRPHLYESRWSDIETNQEDTFLLMPIIAETFELALEAWAIWRRWEIAFHEGRASADTHPALPEDRTRYDEISQELNKRLVMDESQAFCAKAAFQAPEQEKSGPGWKPLIVEWTKVSCQDGVDNRINVKW